MHKLIAYTMQYNGNEIKEEWDCNCSLGYDHDEEEWYMAGKPSANL